MRALAGILLLLVAAIGTAVAADLAVTLVSVTSPVAPYSDATISIRTSPGATCSITVRYKSGPSRAKGLFPQTTNTKGEVTWVWRVGSNTTPGQWPISVVCEQGGDHGELRTSFEVR